MFIGIRPTYRTDTAATVTQLYKPWGEVRYASGTLPTDYTYTGQYSHTADFGLMYYNARWYDPALGRFAQADTIVPGAGKGNASSISQVAGQMYTALTVGYYESPVLAKLNSDNYIIQMYGGLLNMSDQDKRKANIIDVPLNVQVFDRYAYSLNNPLKYIDPSGHVTTEVNNNPVFGYYHVIGEYISIWYNGWQVSINLKDPNLNEDVLAFIDAFKKAADEYSDAMYARNEAAKDLAVAGLSLIGNTGLTGVSLADCLLGTKLGCYGVALFGGIGISASAAAVKIFYDRAALADKNAALAWEQGDQALLDILRLVDINSGLIELITGRHLYGK